MNKELFAYLIIVCVKVLLVFGTIQLMVIAMIWLERKIMAHMQVRLGPMRVGPHGLLQPIADGIKLLFKEDIIPEKASKLLFVLAPAMAMIPALMTFAVIPFGDKVKILGYSVDLVNYRYQYRVPLCFCRIFFRHLWGCYGRLGIKQQILTIGRDTFFGADDQL